MNEKKEVFDAENPLLAPNRCETGTALCCPVCGGTPEAQGCRLFCRQCGYRSGCGE